LIRFVHDALESLSKRCF